MIFCYFDERKNLCQLCLRFFISLRYIQNDIFETALYSTFRLMQHREITGVSNKTHLISFLM